MTNRQIRLARRPSGLPNENIWVLQETPVYTPQDGEVLTKTKYISLDPGMRGMLDDDESFIDPVQIGQVMWAITASEVVESLNPRFAKGDMVVGIGGVQEYSISDGEDLTKVGTNEELLPLTISLLGTTGMVAYFGLLEVGQPLSGQTVVVSAAAGAVGSIVGQIAKILGCRVIGIAGGSEKLQFITDQLGFDGAIDYRKEDVGGRLKELCPEGIDVYFDNVGGEILDSALSQINKNARVVLCGAISQYNKTGTVEGPGNYLSLIVNRARMEGVLYLDYVERFEEAAAQLTRWVEEGKIKSKQHIVGGIENFPEAFSMMFSGDTVGKLLVKPN